MTDHSPQLGEPLRSRERAALDIAIRELRATIRAMRAKGHHSHARLTEDALLKIGALCPEALK